ncbi:MAG: hypothetical protein GDYSWBUE_001074 [Candidatus Fervidibacterota bacterium]
MKGQHCLLHWWLLALANGCDIKLRWGAVSGTEVNRNGKKGAQW